MHNEANNEYPLVSVVCYCRNRADTIIRCIDSILAQDYPNVEIVVQDGASTDGTLELLQGYGDKIRLVSEPDFGPDDAMFRGLSRINGEYFCFCLSDETQMPHMVSWGVENMRKNPQCGAIYTNVHITDIDGNIIGAANPNEWDFEAFFCSETTPPFAGSFFKTECYRAIGFTEYRYDDEFALWINLAARFPVRCIQCDEPIAKFASHSESSAHQAETQIKRCASRKRAIEEFCSNPQIPETLRNLREKALSGLIVWDAMNHCSIGSWDAARNVIPEAYRVGPNPDKLMHLTKLIHRHIRELCENNDLQQALYYLELLQSCGVVGPDVDCQRLQIRRALEGCSGTKKNELVAEELFKTGMQHFQNHKLSWARDYFQKAASCCPNIPNLHLALATAHFQDGDAHSAKQACEKELAIRPDNNGAKNLLHKINSVINDNMPSRNDRMNSKT